MSQETPLRRRRGSGQDGVGSRTAVVSVAVAVVLVAGGGWAVAQAGNDNKTTDTGTPQAGTTSSPSNPTDSPSKKPSKDKNKSWSKQCGRAATAAAHAGYGVLAPSELPSGWTLLGCRYSAATGWHMEVRAGDQKLEVDQRKGDVGVVVTAVLGSGSHQGKDVHAQGTGTWQSWAGTGGKHALSRALSSSGVVLSGTVAVPALNRLADVLMTYESAPNGNNGG